MLGILVTTSRVEVAYSILHVVVDVLRIDRHVDVVVFLLQSRESCRDLNFLVRLEVASRWVELHLPFVFVRYLPLILQGDPRLVLDKDGLLGGDTLEDRREEQLVLVGKNQRRLITVALEVHLLDVGGVVVEDELGKEVIIARLLRRELEANDAESFALNEADVWEGFKGFSWVLLDLVVNGRVRGVLDLHRLVHALVRATSREDDVLRWVELDHRDEGLGARWETVADHADVHTQRRVDVLVHRVFVLALLDRA